MSSARKPYGPHDIAYWLAVAVVLGLYAALVLSMLAPEITETVLGYVKSWLESQRPTP